MALAIIILVMLLTLAHFYLKCSLMSSFSTLIAAILASILAFSYYESLANLFVARGYGVDWAHFGCFLLAFVLGFALFRALADLLVGANIDLGKVVRYIASISCGILTGLIISGNLLVAMGMLPMQSKVLYSRFNPDGPVTLNKSQKPPLNADGFVSGLYSWISQGSMRSSKSFSVLHADFLSQIHLNRLKVKDSILTIGSRDALKLPTGSGKQPVRIWEVADPDDSMNKIKVVVVRMGIDARNISDGGASNKSGQVSFYPAQLRLICKSSGNTGDFTGSGTAVWPIGFIEEGQLVKKKLDEVITPSMKGLKNRTIWLDAAFEVDSSLVPVLLQFKQNAVVDLPAPKPTSEEIEQALNDTDEKRTEE